ncbi:MAG: TonB-dependent receptor [Bacteroidota bacterium]
MLFVYSTPLLSQEVGSISGLVRDAETGDVLTGANVYIKGTSNGTSTDLRGFYLLKNVPTGEQTIVVSYLGFNSTELTVQISGKIRTERDIALEENFYELEGIVVQTNLQGQARALNQQKTALNIKNVVAADLIGRFPDPNVAEALRRVPAITVQRDQGEARYIQIRGTNPNLSNISVNGEQIPSPEGGVRFVALDMIPSDVLTSIEVNKAITPDMDGDAIGGAVNLNTLSAVSGKIMKATIAGNFNNQMDDYSPLGGQLSAAYGDRTNNNKLGYLVSASYTRHNRGSDNNEMEYSDGDLEVLELRDYELTRERVGVITSLDYKVSPTSQFFFNGYYNYFSDQELRRRVNVELDKFGREFKDRFEEQQIFSASFGGDHSLNNRFKIDYMASYSYADQNTPKDRQIVFEQEVEDAEGDAIDLVTFDRRDPDYPQWNLTPDAATAGAGVYNYDAFEFDSFEENSELTTDQHFTSRLNLTNYYNIGSDVVGELKFGGLFRTKLKDRDPNVQIFDFDGDLQFADVQSDFVDNNFLSNEYAQDLGFVSDADLIREFFNANMANFELEEDDSIVDSESERYNATENTYAAYAMTELRKGAWSGIIGARYEFTDIEYTGNIVEFDADGNLLPVREETGTNDFGFFLPMVHLNYAATPLTNIRFAWTNSFARPNYFDLAPYQIINREDEEIELGNPALDPTRAMNFDLMAEYYFNSVGIISAGVFYKRLENFIYIRNFEFSSTGNLNGFEATQPVNGDDADLWGFEVNLQQQLNFLPGFASGFGIYANYTYTYSEATLFNADGVARTVALPGQAESIGNFALSYEKFGFSGRVAMSYAGAFIDELRANEGDDRFYDEHLQIDVSATQRVAPNVQIFAEINNLTNQPLRFYNGVSSRPEQQEFYSFWMNAGIKFRF